jgi:CRISPR/Cas system endoribonuclease Cas6 (RAMP superfamily)
MPYDLRLPLTTMQPSRPGLAEQRGMHAALLSALEAADPALSQQVHNRTMKPFSQALLRGKGGRSLTWRITLLDDALYEPLMQGLRHRPPQHLLRQSIRLDLDKMTCHYQSYQELADTPAVSRYHLAFLTPVTFKQSTHHQPLPEPYRCFQSWWSRWHAFAPAEMAVNVAVLDIVTSHVVIAYFDLHSRMVADGQRRVVGAVGTMKWLVIQRAMLDEEWWQQVATLAAFGRFAATGHKTTQGLGQTEVRLDA